MRSKKELELTVLKHLVTYGKAVSKALGLNIKPDHFTYMEDDADLCYHHELANFIFMYFNESNGSLVTKKVLENRLVKAGVCDEYRAKFMLLWTEIQDEDYDENDLHDLLTQLKRNRALKFWNELHKESHEAMTQVGIEKAIEVASDKLSEIKNEMSQIEVYRQSIEISSSADYFKEEWFKRKDNFDKYKGIYCGMPNIDNVTFGWLPGQVITLLAPSSGGKSIQLLNWASYAHMYEHRNVLYFSFEMDLWQCYLRHLSHAFRIPYADMKSIQCDDEVINSIVDKLSNMGDSYFEYDVNMENPTVEYVDYRIRELTYSKARPDLVVCDYIGNMTTEGTRSNASFWERGGDALEGLHILAKRYEIPFLTAQQLGTDAIKESRKMKDAGKIAKYEQDASYGDKRIIHKSHFVIALEPDKNESMFSYYPVKMRDGTFDVFSSQLDVSCNQIRQLTSEEQQQYMIRRSSASGAKTGNPQVTSNANGETIVKYGGESNIYKPTDLEIAAPTADWVIEGDDD